MIYSFVTLHTEYYHVIIYVMKQYPVTFIFLSVIHLKIFILIKLLWSSKNRKICWPRRFQIVPDIQSGIESPHCIQWDIKIFWHVFPTVLSFLVYLIEIVWNESDSTAESISSCTPLDIQHWHSHNTLICSEWLHPSTRQRWMLMKKKVNKHKTNIQSVMPCLC